MEQVRSIEGTVTLADGSVSHFVKCDSGWLQWGANTERLGRTVPIMEALTSGLSDGEVVWEED